MGKTSRAEFGRIIQLIEDRWPNHRITANAFEDWYESLSRYPCEWVADSVRNIYRTSKIFQPQLADVIEQCRNRQRRVNEGGDTARRIERQRAKVDQEAGEIADCVAALEPHERLGHLAMAAAAEPSLRWLLNWAVRRDPLVVGRGTSRVVHERVVCGLAASEPRGMALRGGRSPSICEIDDDDVAAAMVMAGLACWLDRSRDEEQ